MNASVASNCNKMLAQVDIDRMILDFAIKGLLPYRFVSLPSFNRIIKAISPKFNVMSESTLKRRYADLATTITQNLKSIFGDLSFCHNYNRWLLDEREVVYWGDCALD